MVGGYIGFGGFRSDKAMCKLRHMYNCGIIEGRQLFEEVENVWLNVWLHVVGCFSELPLYSK